MLFQDRVEAGAILARHLLDFAHRDDVVVLALPRGGVPVAAEVAAFLDAPLDVFVVRKLGVPGQEEFAMGAIASGGVRVVNWDIVRAMRIPASIVDDVTRAEQRELERREQLYRGDRPPVDVAGRTVILVDDGLATGATMKAAVRAVRELSPRQIVVAVPVSARDACVDLGAEADACVAAETPEPFFGVGRWYRNFSQTTDEEVRRLLARARRGAQPTLGTF